MEKNQNFWMSESAHAVYDCVQLCKVTFIQSVRLHAVMFLDTFSTEISRQPRQSKLALYAAALYFKLISSAYIISV